VTRTRPLEEVERDIATERAELSRAVAGLRDEIASAKAAKTRLLVRAAAAGAVGFVLVRSVRATIRLLAARTRK
jgi:hypothetical protein